VTVLRRYLPGQGPDEVGYEHAVLAHLAAAGWVVPEPVSDLVPCHGLWYGLTRYVPGGAVAPESPAQRARRGRDLARLHLAVRGLGERIGQRPGWRAQHTGLMVNTAADPRACLRALTRIRPDLGAWAAAAVTDTRAALATAAVADLPAEVVHGDFAEWNVHYAGDQLAGVVDFGLTHLDSRPYELAIARTYRAPEVVAAYRAELDRGGWPLTAAEEAALTPVYRAFRLDMALDAAGDGLRSGDWDLAMIERQLARTGTPRP
jgi:homoserine kinase type II